MSTESCSTFLTTAQFAQRIGIRKTTAAGWRSRGVGPKFVRLSRRCVRYDSTAVDAWIAARERATVSTLS
jgi:predicted DNA-binding transcriptional regulator AlpA